MNFLYARPLARDSIHYLPLRFSTTLREEFENTSRSCLSGPGFYRENCVKKGSPTKVGKDRTVGGLQFFFFLQVVQKTEKNSDNSTTCNVTSCSVRRRKFLLDHQLKTVVEPPCATTSHKQPPAKNDRQSKTPFFSSQSL